MSRLLPVALLLCLVAASTVYGLRYPDYNWDMIPYLAAVVALEEEDPEAIHAAAYGAVRETLPEGRFRDLAEGDAYRRAVYGSAESLAQQLPFYAIRPLYIGLVWLLHQAGAELGRSTVLVSSIAYGWIVLVLWLWLGRGLSPWPRLGVAAILALGPPLTEVANVSTPDALSAALVLTGIYLGTERRSPLLAGGVLLLSVFARTDNVLLCLAFALLFALEGGLRRWRLVAAGAYAALCLATVATVNNLAGNYGWATVIRHTFLERLALPGEAEAGVGLLAYLKLLAFGTFSLRHSMLGLCTLLLFVGALGLRDAGLWRERRVRVALLLFGGVLAHYVLFPAFWDRFFVAHYLAIETIWVLVLAEHLRARLAPVTPLPALREEPELQVARKATTTASAPTR